MKLKFIFAAGMACWAALLCSTAHAQAPVPTTVMVTYKSTPRNRVAFYDYLQTKQIPRLEKWKQAGVFSNYRLLFEENAAYKFAPDAVLILTFPTYFDTYKWVDIEKEMPGGLTEEGLKLAAPEDTTKADILDHTETSGADEAQMVFEYSRYKLTVDEDHYRKLFAAFPAPMFKNFIQQGELAGYDVYFDQNSDGAPWDVVILLAWKNRAAWSHVEEVKAKASRVLDPDPAYKAAASALKAIRVKTLESFYYAVEPTPQ